MSIFTETDSNQEKPQTEQVETTEETQNSFVDKLVQAKGENWRNPETLAKGKLEADTYISKLEDQNKQLREDLSKNDYAAQVLDAIKDKAADTSTAKDFEAEKNTAGVEEGGTPPSLNEDNLKSLVEKTLLERETKKSSEENIKTVERTLRDRFGEKLSQALQDKASELGLSMNKMEELASESPNAFLTLFGGTKQESGISNMLNNSINTEGLNLQSSTERNWNYYQNLRRENRNLYYTPKVQQQMIQDKLQLGEKFGN
jgi:hypothetical protein